MAEEEKTSSAQKEAKSLEFDPNLLCGPTTAGAAAAPPPTMQPSSSTSKAHAPKCACGCVPAILSLFEMAELRKQARLKKAAEKNASI